MRYAYGEYDGHEFPSSEKLFGLDPLMDFLLQHGERALRAIQEAMGDPESNARELLDQLIRDGMFDQDGKGKLRLTPRAVNRMQLKALEEVFGNLRSGQREGHEKITTGTGGERVEGTRAYEFGDPIGDLDLHETMRNAMTRRARESNSGGMGVSPVGLHHGRDARATGEARATGRPSIRFSERDFHVQLREGTTSCSTVVLIDLSGSMMRHQRYLSAKRVALALLALVRQRFPSDTIDFVGFYSGANKIPEVTLPLIMPKPVTIHDYEVRLRCKIDQINKAPQHFTNLHLGLQMSRRILRRRAGENKQMFIITDGQPTAHVDGDEIYLLYPPDQHSAVATLKEAMLCAREGIRLSTFALMEDYWGMDWVGFVDQLTRLTRGVAFYTSSGELANCVMESYLSGRRRKAFIGK